MRGEYAENFFRKAFTPTEWADIADEMEPIERAAAKERQEAAGVRGKEGGRGKKKPSGEIPPRVSGKALDKIAKVVGKDRKTITKARAIRDAAAAEPERFGKLKEDMDRTGRVDAPFKRLKVMRQAAAIRAEAPPYPNQGPYRVITADPPWAYEMRKEDNSHRAAHAYATMSIAQICAEATKVQAIAHPDCILWLWTTNHHMLSVARPSWNLGPPWPEVRPSCAGAALEIIDRPISSETPSRFEICIGEDRPPIARPAIKPPRGETP